LSSADAIVVGAGICGAAVAHFLAERGREVLVLDRGGIAEGTSSRGEGNVLVCDKPGGPEREFARHGRALWESLGERYPAGRVTRTGALLLYGDGDGDRGGDLGGGGETREDAAAREAAAALGDAAGLGDAAALGGAAALEPALAPGVRAVHEPGDLMVDPPGMTRALLHPIDVRTGAQVTGIANGGVTLDGGERLTARDVIVCAGPWSGPLTGLPVEPRKGQLVALRAPARLVRHKLIEGAYVDAVTADGAGLIVASVIEQTLDGDEVLVGSSRERVGFDETVDHAVTRAMLERAYRWVPALRELEVTREWAGLRPWLPDGRPAVGPLVPASGAEAGRGGVWASTGHEGSGVCLGPVSGLLLAQLVCGETPIVDPTPFDPRRFRA
jgi:glycine/D-amino acid oxidase-like deaminating enzyme